MNPFRFLTKATLLWSAFLFVGGSSHQLPSSSDPTLNSFAKIQFETDQITAAPGSTHQLTVFSVGKDGAKKPVDFSHLSFKVSDPSLATVLADGSVHVNNHAAHGSKETITAKAGHSQAQCELLIPFTLEHTVEKKTGEPLPVVTNAQSTAVVVNKQRRLPEGYTPKDLVVPNVPFSFEGTHEKKHLRKAAAHGLERLFAAANKDDMDLRAVSGYRSYKRQQELFQKYVKTRGEATARRFSALPGTSEHQTGLAIDLSSPKVGNELNHRLADTEEAKWLAKNAPRFGFIVRYPKGKEAVTGYAYEPWHLRYVGKTIAREVTRRGIVLEEYFDGSIPVSGEPK
ncbi:M15 family metallopeptidase [Salinithrix halophila]|uniref:D-alanyl-D-alanine carboxypeptidase family protein n=1 Tax=Salinithrix halophila TaxID=1485204 RepID=A0ABV8JDQ6_9BACL